MKYRRNQHLYKIKSIRSKYIYYEKSNHKIVDCLNNQVLSCRNVVGSGLLTYHVLDLFHRIELNVSQQATQDTNVFSAHRRSKEWGTN